jgi:hypothetical protein
MPHSFGGTYCLHLQGQVAKLAVGEKQGVSAVQNIAGWLTLLAKKTEDIALLRN